MNVDLHRYQLPVPASRLAAVLASASDPVEPLGIVVDFSECFELVDDLRDRSEAESSTRRSPWDAELAGPLHAALSGVTRRDASDPRLWHWLCTATHFREYVWHRWHGLVPADPAAALTDGDLPRRFLGSASLVGMARNALARLYWTVETLSDGADPEEGLALARTVLQRTDLHSAVFERLLGLHPPAARAAVRVLSDVKEDEHRRAVRRLNHLATTTLLEALSEDEVAEVLAVG